MPMTQFTGKGKRDAASLKINSLEMIFEEVWP